MVRLFLLLHLTGLVIARDVEKRLFFTTVWYIVFGAEAVLYLILRIRERQQQKDFLESGKIYRIVVVAGAGDDMFGSAFGMSSWRNRWK